MSPLTPYKKYALVIPIILFFVGMFIFTRVQFEHYPDAALDGTPWNKDWAMLGTVLGVEEPGNGFAPKDNHSILTTDDTFYATWVAGDTVPFTNEEGKEVEVYEAQIYLLLYGCADAAAAQEACADWMARERELYTVTGSPSAAHNGVAYQLLVYDCGSDTNPYHNGASAFGVYKNYAVVAELTCREGYAGNAEAQLADFLRCCHFSAEE